jgi:tetratricopeptide (TPR) repeat protein
VHSPLQGRQGAKVAIDTELETARAQLEQLPLDAPAQPGPLPVGSRMTLARSPLFGGRDAELQRIAAAVKRARVVALTGPAGAGKTQLAVEFAHRYGAYFTGGVFWVSFAVPEDVSLQVAACGGAGALALRADFGDLALDDQLHLVLRAWQGETPRLLVFDDCEDETALQEWLPTGGAAHVLVTSRRPTWEGSQRVTVLAVGPLGRAESGALLGRIGPDVAEGDAALEHIVDELEGLPLALRLAGGMLHRYQSSLSPEHLVQELGSREVLDRASLLEEQDQVPARQVPASRRALFSRRRGQPSSPAARMFVLAERWLERSDPVGRSALALLTRAACFAAGEPVPRTVLLDAAGDPLSADSLVRLVDLGLLEPDGDLVRLHRVLVELVRLARPDAGAVVAAEEAMIAWAQSVNDGGAPEGRLLAVPHLDVAARVSEPAANERSAALRFELGRALWAAGDLRRARVLMEAALEVREELLGADDHRTIATLSALGSLLQAQGDLAGAQTALERALALAEATLGGEHADTAVILTNLAWTLRFQGDLAGARALLERALRVSERTLGGDNPDTVARLDGLAMLLREQGNLAAARGYAERAMDVLERTLGPDHPRTLVAINSVGLLLREQGDLAAARTYLEHTLRVSDQTLGPEHPDTATALDNMGTLLQAEGDLEAAREHIERGLAIRERALGLDNPATGTSYTNVGMLLREQGDLEGARPFLEQALIVSQRILGPYDPQTAASYNNLGTLLLELGDLYGAQPHLERALAIREQGLGADHPETATSLANVAALHIAYGDPAGGRAYLERALEIREEVLGPDDPLTGDTFHQLGQLLKRLGDLQRARAHLERAVAIRERALGPDHPDTLASMTEHDEVARELGGRRPGWPPRRLPEAEFFERDAGGGPGAGPEERSGR